MDIHRCRFVPYQPQSISASAFSHPSNNKQKPPRDLRLALGRENGDIEIWNPILRRWHQEKILRGSRDRTIEQLVWTQDMIVDEDNEENTLQDGSLRLFSSGGSSSITEWDLATGQQKRHAEGIISEIWCFASQPQWKRGGKSFERTKVAAAPSQLLAAGCADGSVILFSTADESLQFNRVLVAGSRKPGSKVISITWRDRSTIIAGYEGGYIQLIDVPTKSVHRKMTLGKSGDGSTPVVWTVSCLLDGTILSGDSSGELKIWDAKTLSLTQSLKAHNADILAIATNIAGDRIFTTGVDRRLVAFKQLASSFDNNKRRWQIIAHRRYHQHDVKTLASYEAKEMSVLVSGGVDTVPVVMPLKNWETENHRTLTHLPQRPQMSCSSTSRLMLTWWHRDLLVWNIPQAQTEEYMEQAILGGTNHQLLTRIQLQGDEDITSAQISKDGKMIVAATVASVKLFQIRRRTEAGEVEIRTRPVDLPMSIRSVGATTVGFSPDSKWLFAVRTSNVIVMVKILTGSSSKDKPQVYQQVIKLGHKQRKDRRPGSGTLGQYPQTTNCVSFSPDSRILATGDLAGSIDTWVLEGHEDLQGASDAGGRSNADDSSDSGSESDSDDETDSRVIHGQKWDRNPSGASFPRLGSAIVALSFKPQSSALQNSAPPLGLHATRHNPHPVSHELPSQDTKLVVVTASHQILEFDVMSSSLSDWSRRNPSSHLPQSFTQIKDRVMGVFWDCVPTSKKERLWLYGPTWLFMLDMTRDLNMIDALDKVGRIGDHDVREPLSSTSAAKRMIAEPTSFSMRKKAKRNTGAGDQKRADETLIPVVTQANGDATEIDTGLVSPVSDNEDEDDDTEMGITGALTKLRRGGSKEQAQDQLVLHADDSTDQPDSLPTQQQSPSHHTIFRYRSIFGIAVLQPQQHQPNDDDNTAPATAIATKDPTSTSDATTPPNLEIILVERPLYDIELPPRFDGGQDWTT